MSGRHSRYGEAARARVAAVAVPHIGGAELIRCLFSISWWSETLSSFKTAHFGHAPEPYETLRGGIPVTSRSSDWAPPRQRLGSETLSTADEQTILLDERTLAPTEVQGIRTLSDAVVAQYVAASREQAERLAQPYRWRAEKASGKAPLTPEEVDRYVTISKREAGRLALPYNFRCPERMPTQSR